MRRPAGSTTRVPSSPARTGPRLAAVPRIRRRQLRLLHTSRARRRQRIWLGSHSPAEAAAHAYDAALLCLKESAAAVDLNFPLCLPFDLPPAAMSPKAIQRVAAAATLGQHLLRHQRPALRIMAVPAAMMTATPPRRGVATRPPVTSPPQSRSSAARVSWPTTLTATACSASMSPRS